MRIEPRLQKIEAAFRRSGPSNLFTTEETRIAGYEFRLAILKADRLPERREEVTASKCRLEDEIRCQAQKQLGQQYRRHVEWVTEVWLASGRSLPFVSPVIGSDYDDWDQPNLAARRLAVRRRPSVIALIGEPDAETAPDLVPAAPFNPIKVLISLMAKS